MLFQIIVSGITAGSIYALIALGFVLLYKGTHVVHFGYGDQVTLGAYLVVIFHSFLLWPFYESVLMALVLAGLLGFFIERFAMRPIGTRPILVQIIATLAIGTAIREGIRAYFGPLAWPFEFLLSPTPILIGDIILVPANLAVVVVSLVIMLLAYVFFAVTTYGKAILAACSNRVGASIIGISVPAVFSTIWIVASVLAAVAGILVAPLITLTPDMGLIGIKGFAAAVLGGFNSLPGALVGGLLLGLIETMAGVYVSSATKDVVSFALLIGIILVRPEGLFGRRIAKKV